MTMTTGFLNGAAMAAVFSMSPALAEDLTKGLASEPTSIDPHYHNLRPNNSMFSHIFEMLIIEDEGQRLTPGLAVSWAPIDDLTSAFKLREGVTFHDGSPFTADDVIFSFERAPDVPNSPSSLAGFLKGKNAIKVDDLTRHIKTDAPYPLMANDLSVVAIVSDEVGKDASTEDYTSGAAAIGTRPFKFAEYVPGDRIVLERNDDYWGEVPAWEKVTFKPIDSNPSRVAALLAGDVGMIEGVSNRVIYLHLDHARTDSPFVQAKDGGPIDNPLQDLRVRMAISRAIDRDAIVERVMEGVAIKADQLPPEFFFGVSPNLEPVEFDPEGAKALLAEAGVPDGFKLTIHGPNDRSINDAKLAEAIAQMLTSIGIETAVETMPRSVYFSRASAGGPDGTSEFSFILVGWGAGSGEASDPLRALIHTYDEERGFGATNRGRYSNAEVDAVIEEALASVDDPARQDLLAKATEMAINDGAIIRLHYQVNTWGTRKGLTCTPYSNENTLAMAVKAE